MTDREADREFQRVVTEGLVPKVKDSAVCVSIYDRHEVDAHMALELGVMIMLDKPILVVVDPSVSIPGKLAAVADKVVVGNIADPADTQRVANEISAFQAEHGGEP